MEHRADAEVRYIGRHLGHEETRRTRPLGESARPGMWCRRTGGAYSVGPMSSGAIPTWRPSRSGRSVGRQNIILADLDEIAISHDQFDLVCMSHVIEHLPAISQTLSGILRVLAPGGHLFLEVPNCFAEMFSEGVSTESHLNFFTRGSLRVLLERPPRPAYELCDMRSSQGVGPPTHHEEAKASFIPRLVETSGDGRCGYNRGIPLGEGT